MRMEASVGPRFDATSAGTLAVAIRPADGFGDMQSRVDTVARNSELLAVQVADREVVRTSVAMACS